MTEPNAPKRALTARQKTHLQLAAMGFFSVRVERTCPSLERRGLVERYRHTEHGRSYVDWRITEAGRAEAKRLREAEKQA